ncbi:MAG: hypothetical protein WC220_00015 [Pedobacter sp.]|jgi:hypothetical protein
MFCAFCGKKVSSTSIYCKYCGGKIGENTAIKYRISISNLFRPRIMQILVIILVLIAIASGVTLAYSKKHEQYGDKEYKNNKYTSALEEYLTAKKFWLPERIHKSFKNSDLESKINKAQVMIRSDNHYELGMDAYHNKNYSEALQQLSLLASNDARIQEVQATIQDIKIIMQPTPTAKPSPAIYIKRIKIGPTAASVPQENMEEIEKLQAKVEEIDQNIKRQELYAKIYNDCINERKSHLSNFNITEDQRVAIMANYSKECTTKAEAEVYK